MLVFMVTKDDLDRYGIWKTFLGSKQPSLTQMLEFGKWAVFKPIGLLMQATIIDFNTEGDTLESSEAIELAPTTATTGAPKLPSPKGPPPPPPPPAPPPPPPVVRKESIGIGDGPKCKKLSWKELKIDVKDTIWEKVNLQLKSVSDVIDKDEVFELFREKPRKSRKFSAHSPSVSNPEEVQAIGGKKQLNISIALAHHQLTADNLISAVNKVDIRLLQPDFISSFESMLPDQNEEASLLQKFSKKNFEIGTEILTDPEEFSYLLSSVPEFRKKIKAMVFQCSFYDRVNAICKNLDIVREASKEIRQSQKLQIVLMYILSVGRIMNNSSTKAFNIDFLSTASCFKSSDGETRFLMFLVQKLLLHDAEVLQLPDELPNLQNAAKVSLNDIDRDSTELAVEYSSIALELESVSEESEIFKEFVRQGKFDLNHLKRKRRQVQQELTEVAEYFGMDTNKSKPIEVFSTIRQFIKDLTTANDNLTKKALSRKNSSRAMMRSFSTPTFKRSSRNSSFRGSRNSSAKSSRNSSARSSMRRAYRSVSVASAGSDVQDEKVVETSTVSDQRNLSSESSSFYLGRSYSENGTPKSHYRSSRTTEHDNVFDCKKEEKEWPKEPDLLKYRSLMREYEERQKAKRANEERKEEISRGRGEDKEEGGEDQKLRKVFLSPVKEKIEARRLFEISKSGVSEPEKDLKIENRLKEGETICHERKDSFERELEIKEAKIMSFIDANTRKHSNEIGGKRVADKRIKVNGHRDDTCGTDRLANESPHDKGLLVMQSEISNQECNMSSKERPKELRTLHYRAKNTFERENNCGQEANEMKRSKRSEREFAEGDEIAGEKERRDFTDAADLKVWKRKKEKTAREKQTELVYYDDYYNVNLKRHSTHVTNSKKNTENGQRITKDYGGNWKDEDRTDKEATMTGRSERNADAKISRKLSNGKSNFVRGSTRGSVSRSRSSSRNSFKNERGVKRVNVKALQARDIARTMTMPSSRSESNFGSTKSQRRRTRSEGIQAVILKPGFIAKNVPMKLDLTKKGNENKTRGKEKDLNIDKERKVAHSEPTETSMKAKDCNNNEEGLEEDKGRVNGCDPFVEEGFELKENQGPVLRRTKSAVIQRNVREAKLIFYL